MRHSIGRYLRTDENVAQPVIKAWKDWSADIAADLRVPLPYTLISRVTVRALCVVYHLGRATVMPIGRLQVRLVIRWRDGKVARCNVRLHGSDLSVLREVFVLQSYAVPQRLLDFDVRKILDLGSNIGLSAAYLSAHFPHATVVCVEPVEENLEVLLRTARRHHGLWFVAPVAVGAADGTESLYVTGWWSSCTTVAGVSRRRNRPHRPEGAMAIGIRRVPARTPQSILDFAKSELPDLIKIDIEGEEGRVLTRASMDWMRDAIAVFVDFHDKYEDLEDSRDSLLRMGFTSVDKGGRGECFLRGSQ